MEDLVGQSSCYSFVGTIELGPYLFEQHHPDFTFASWFGENGLTFEVHREVVVNQNLLVFSIVQHPCHIDAVRTDLEGGEDVFYSVVLFSQGCQRRQEVAVS